MSDCMGKKLLTLGITLLMLLSITYLTACNPNEEGTSDFMQGTYTTDDGTGQIKLYGDDEYSFNIIFISRRISGGYTVTGSKLSLYDNNYELLFSIENDKIVFVAAFVDDKEEDWIIQPRKEFFYQELTEVDTSGMVECSEFHFESVRSSPGTPIVLNYNNSEAIFECSVNSGLFYLLNVVDENNIEVAPGGSFWWIPSEDSFNSNNRIFVDVVLKLDNKIIGYAVIELYSSDSTRLNFFARTIKASLFPIINGEYQTVTAIQVNSIINKIKDQK